MPEESRVQLAASFGRVVEDYDRGRPNYPEATVEWMVGDARRVVDLGAGTGKLTRSLVAPEREVVALEPQEPMIKQLHATLDGAIAACAGAEAIPLTSGWADVVVVAQAFHWFDQQRALPEIARVLRSGGRLSLVWNVRDESVGWVAELTRITGRDNSTSTRMGLDPTPYFGGFETLRFPTVQVMNGDTLVAHVRSRSNVAAMPDSERTAVIDAVVQLCSTHPDVAGKQTIEFPYVTEAYRAMKE
jgi:ubiquinone/menaquinone biosynthesis C-methylase UbiE